MYRLSHRLKSFGIHARLSHPDGFARVGKADVGGPLAARSAGTRGPLGALLVALLSVSPVWAQIDWRSALADAGEGVGSVGAYSSLAILPDGSPAVSHFDLLAQQLRYSVRLPIGWRTTVVDADGQVGEYTSLAILPDGNPAIAYHDIGNGRLKYAWFDGKDWQNTVVDPVAIPAFGTSLAIRPDGNPAIAYRDHLAGTLRFAAFDGRDWRAETVDDTTNCGHYASLAFGPAGHSAIVYLDFTHDRLMLAEHDGFGWRRSVVAAPGGIESRLIYAPDGRPVIVHGVGFGLTVRELIGGVWQSVEIDRVFDFGSWFSPASLAVDAAGELMVGYARRQFPFEPEMTLNRRTAGGWVRTALGDGWGGGPESLALLPNGKPALAFRYLNHLYFGANIAAAGDLDCDGRINFDDITPFVVALASPAAYAAQYPDCRLLNADAGGDGDVDFDDIDGFVDLLIGR